MVTDYILNHADGRDIVLVYDGQNGISQRVIHVMKVTDQIVRGMDGDAVKTFRRDRILSAGWVGAGMMVSAKVQRFEQA